MVFWEEKLSGARDKSAEVATSLERDNSLSQREEIISRSAANVGPTLLGSSVIATQEYYLINLLSGPLDQKVVTVEIQQCQIGFSFVGICLFPMMPLPRQIHQRLRKHVVLIIQNTDRRIYFNLIITQVGPCV